jgi:hypothetical protein
MFRPPVGIDERSTAPLAFWIAGFLCLAAVMIAIT